MCRVGGNVGQVQVVWVACLTGSQRKGLSGISPDMVLVGWTTSLRLLVLVDTRQPDLRGRAACCWMVCVTGGNCIRDQLFSLMKKSLEGVKAWVFSELG